jgi:hypothetical protein
MHHSNKKADKSLNISVIKNPIQTTISRERSVELIQSNAHEIGTVKMSASKFIPAKTGGRVHNGITTIRLQGIKDKAKIELGSLS